MKRDILFYSSCVATASDNGSSNSLHSATILKHTIHYIACSHIFFSEQNIVIPEITLTRLILRYS